MATGRILLPANCWQPGDGSTGNVAPARGVTRGTQTPFQAAIPTWGFDGAGSVIESINIVIPMPGDYASGGALKLFGTINNTTGNVAFMQAKVSAVTPADTDTPYEHAFNSAATVSITANTTEARRLLSGDITLTMDSAAASDQFVIQLLRDPTNGSDTHTSDFEFSTAEFSYTTT